MPTRPVRRFRLPGLLVLLCLSGAACHGGGGEGASGVFTNSSLTPTPSFSGPPETVAPSPTRPALPPNPPATSGPASATCVQGWTAPAPGSTQYLSPLPLIRTITHTHGPLKVVDMRYFVGPESPPSEQGYIKEIERWYVKVYDPADYRFQGRFILEHLRFGHGVVAVAPYDTKGFSSPDWSGFQWDAGDTARRSYAGLPGTWEGVRYDFVKGGAGLTIPGLPDAVLGCLAGT
jgi:hypothetical protein